MPPKGASCDVPYAQYDPTNPGGTYHPNLPPATEKGADFKPLKMDFSTIKEDVMYWCARRASTGASYILIRAATGMKCRL